MLAQVGLDFGQGEHVGVLLVHVEEVHRVRGLVAVEDALLDHDHFEAVGAAVDDRGADAAAGALATDDQRVDAQVVQVGQERRALERAGRRLAEHHFARGWARPAE